MSKQCTDEIQYNQQRRLQEIQKRPPTFAKIVNLETNAQIQLI